MRIIVLCFLIVTSSIIVNAQTDVYSVTSGELIFGWADVQQRPLDGGDMETVSSNLRFTLFLHLGQYVHADFSNSFGLYSGLAMRNIGFITEDSSMGLEKEKHRSYSLGIPLALKLGAFDKSFYVFGGAEYELLFHYKFKYWQNGDKYKTTEWFSNRTKRFIPSVFAGVQFPHGLNVKFRYYLDDFLNSDFKKGDDPINDYSRFGKTQMFHVSVCWQFRTDKLWKAFEGDAWDDYRANL